MTVLIGISVIAVLAGAVYVVVTLLFIPGLAEERLGRLEQLPSDVGQWRFDTGAQPDSNGLRRQTRLWVDAHGSLLGRERVLLQARWVDPDTGQVVRTEPDRRVKRRRVKSS